MNKSIAENDCLRDGDFYFYADNDEALAKRLAKNSGVYLHRKGEYFKEKYKPDIFRPINSWLPLGPKEFQGLLSSKNPEPHNSVIIKKIPEKFRKLFYHLRLNEMNDSKEKFEEMSKNVLPAFVKEIKAFLEKEIFFPFNECNVAINTIPAGLESTIFDLDLKIYRGLHIDNWGVPLYSPNERDKCGGRICFNFGQEKREIVLINLTAKKLLQLIKEKNLDDYEKMLYQTKLTDFVEVFLNHYPSHPLIKLSILPNEAYILPVQNCIHDGYSLFKKKLDVSFHISSNHFEYRVKKKGHFLVNFKRYFAMR